jgi:hypothetical protein
MLVPLLLAIHACLEWVTSASAVKSPLAAVLLQLILNPASSALPLAAVTVAPAANGAAASQFHAAVTAACRESLTLPVVLHSQLLHKSNVLLPAVVHVTCHITCCVVRNLACSSSSNDSGCR